MSYSSIDKEKAENIRAIQRLQLKPVSKNPKIIQPRVISELLMEEQQIVPP